MPNLEKSIAKLKEYQGALSQLKGGNSIIVDGVELSPSMKQGDNDSDLSSVKRMISRLEMQVERAKSQEMRKGVIIEGEDGQKKVGFSLGVPALADEMGLKSDDLSKIVPTGSNGTVSRRDVRVYARAKSDGKLAEYAKRAKSRRTGKNIAVESPQEPATGAKGTDSDKPKTLGQMNKKELIEECEKLGIKKNGTKKTISGRIRSFLKGSDNPKTDETPAPDEQPEKDETPDSSDSTEKAEPVSPLA